MATKTSPDLDYRERWLNAHAEAAEADAKRGRANLAAFKGSKSTPYALSILELAEAHEEAAAVYRRRIEELS